MTWSTVLPWLAALAVLVLVALFLRYRALERGGTPLPPGVGGSRMVGTTGHVVTAHDPSGSRGAVHVLGEDWPVADDVTTPLAVGELVRVERVEGTRLVVTPTTDADRTPTEGT